MRVLIVGAGIVGAMTAWHLARAGHEVLVFEQFDLDHDWGSSYGDSRVVRRVYSDPFYTRLMADAYPLWEEFQSYWGDELFTQVGGIFFGPPEHREMREAESALRLSKVDYERLEAAECARRFPAFKIRSDEIALFEPSMGYARASQCVRAATSLAQSHGARFHFQTPIASMQRSGESIQLTTATGEVFNGDRLLICAGSWTAPLLARLNISLPLQVVRKTYLHLQPARNEANFEAGRFPVWIDAASFAYGFPRLGHTPGIKLAFHIGGEVTTPEEAKRELTEDDRRPLLEYAAARFPDLSSRIVYEKVCLYTNTPDEDFIIDQIPGLPGAFIVGGTSGHGFKFGPLFGTIAQEILMDNVVPYDLSRFSLSRFSLR
jgi:monomeric sarcosine oxidase